MKGLYLLKFLGGAQPNFWCSATGVISQVGFLLNSAPCLGASMWPFLLGRIFLAAKPHGFGL